MVEDLFKFPFEAKATSLLRNALNNPDATFREDQLQAIIAVTKNRNKLLLVERTGWGKSMVYFIATKIMRDKDYYPMHLNQHNFTPGPALIISPLLALMRNQVYSSKNILEMASINSSQNSKENLLAQQRFLANELDMLIVSPERLSNQDFMENILAPMASKIPLMIVDEAHCISDWGHDFRPDYKRIKNIISNLPSETPLLATTATANERVIKDINHELDSKIEIMRGELTRSSINLRVKVCPTIEERFAIIATDIESMKSSGMGHAGIVYVLTVNDSVRIAKWLSQRGILANAYYAGLDNEEKIKLEQQLIDNEIDVLIATSALSMGFDKPDLGFVYHFQTPQSVVHYYQQVGRAGRAIPQAFGTCLLGKEDGDIVNFFIKEAYPKREDMTEIVEYLSNVESASIKKIEANINLKPSKIEKCLKILSTLENPPIIQDNSLWKRTVNSLEVDEDKIKELYDLRIKEWKEMIQYVHGKSCLTKYLSKSLGDEIEEDCGRCSNCIGDDSWSTYKEEILIEARKFMNRISIPLDPRKTWLKPDFKEWPHLNGRIDSSHMAEQGLALCYLTDPLYGKKIISGKENGFDESIIEALSSLIKSRWSEFCINEDAKKEILIVPVPSRRNQSVSLLSNELAEKLNFSSASCIKKIRNNDQQKYMENSSYQKMNLDGVFSVTDSYKLKNKNIILIDDVVNSKWTLTVCAALLKEAGAKKVYPLALAARNGDNIVEHFF